MYKADFINYFDVWGNPEEGYEVNNLCTQFENIELENTDDETLISKLKELHFFTDKANTDNTYIEDLWPHLEVYDKETDYPFGRFDIIE